MKDIKDEESIFEYSDFFNNSENKFLFSEYFCYLLVLELSQKYY